MSPEAAMGALRLADAAATIAAGEALGAVLRAGDTVTLAGPLGSGKTTFARGVLAALGLAGEAPSPSFGIVIGYARPDVRLPVSHADLYRIEAAAEVRELGLEDALEEGALLVEWPDRLGPEAWREALALTFAVEDGDARRLTWAAPAAWGPRWPLR